MNDFPSTRIDHLNRIYVFALPWLKKRNKETGRRQKTDLYFGHDLSGFIFSAISRCACGNKGGFNCSNCPPYACKDCGGINGTKEGKDFSCACWTNLSTLSRADIKGLFAAIDLSISIIDKRES